MSFFLKRPTRLVREFAWLSVSNQLTAALSLAVMVLLARSLSVTEFGQVVFAQAVAGLALLVLDVRFDDAIQRFHPIVRRQGDDSSGRAFYWKLVRLDLIFGLTFTAAAVALYVLNLYPTNDIWQREYLILALIGAGLGTAVGSLNAGFAITDHLSELARLQILASTVSAALSVVGLFVAGGVGYLTGLSVATVLQVGILWSGVRRRISTKDTSPSKWPPGFLGFLLKSSGASTVAAAGESGVLVVAGLLGSPAFVAIVKVAQAPSRVLVSLFSPISVQVFPRLSNLAAAGDWVALRQSLRAVTMRSAKMAAVLSIVSAASLWTLIPVLYGDSFRVAVEGAILLAFAACTRGAVTWVKVLPLAVGQAGLRLLVVGVESIGLLVTTAVAASIDGVQLGVGILGVGTLIIAVMTAAYWGYFASRLGRRAVDIAI